MSAIRLILLTVAVCVSVTFIASVVTLLWWLYIPLYTAEAYLRVIPTPDAMMKEPPVYDQEVIERHKRTQAALIKTEYVLRNAAKDERITRGARDWYSRHKDDIVNELADEIDVSILPETELIKLSMTGTNRTELPAIVNAVAHSFVKFAGRGPTRTQGQQIGTLQAQRDTLKKELDRIRRDEAAARGASLLAGMQERQNAVSIKLQFLVRGLAEAEIAQSQAEAALEACREDIKSGAIQTKPQVLQALECDATLRALEAGLVELQTKARIPSPATVPGRGSTEDLQSAVEWLRRQIDQRRKEVISIQSQAIGQMRQAALLTATKHTADMTRRVEEVKLEANDLEIQLGRITALGQEAEDARDKIRLIDQRILDLQLLMRATPGEEEAQAAPVTIEYEAQEPREPSYPKWELTIPAGAVVGLVLGVVLALVRRTRRRPVAAAGDTLA